MKSILMMILSIASFSALADQTPCYSQMSEVVYSAYAKFEKITVVEAKKNADVFVDAYKKITTGHTYKVEIAEQYVNGSESGYFPGTKFEVKLSKECRLVSIKKI